MNMYKRAKIAIAKIEDPATRKRAMVALAHHKNHTDFMHTGIRKTFGKAPHGTRPHCARLAQRSDNG